MTAPDRARFRILGPIEAWTDERQLELGGPRQRTLLAFFLLHPNRAVSSDALIDALWKSNPTAPSAHCLAVAIARLRKALEPLNAGGTPLRTVSGGYLLTVATNELDANRFSASLQAGLTALNTGDAARATWLVDEALKLWRGAPLAEVCFEDFAQPELRRLEEMRLVAFETRIEAELQLGHHRQLVGELEAMLAQEPTRERIAHQLMLALYRSGRQADALNVFQRTRIHLAATLGLQPGQALTVLQLQILHQTPSLHPSGPAGKDALVAPLFVHQYGGTFPASGTSHPTFVEHALTSRTSCSRPLPTRITLTRQQTLLQSRQPIAQ